MIKPFSIFDILCKRLSWMNLVVIFLGACVWAFVQFTQEKSVERNVLIPPKNKVKHSSINTLPKLGTKNLNVSLLNLESKVDIFLLPKRLDTKEKEQLHLFIKGYDKPTLIEYNRPIYLKEKDRQLFFTEEKTSFWMKFEKKDKKLTHVAITAELPDFDFPYYKIQNRAFYTVEPKLKISNELLNERSFQSFMKALWWGEDLLASFVDPKQKAFHRFVLDGKTYLLSEKQCFIWNGKYWALAPEKTEGFVLAHVKKITKDQIFIDGWDEIGKRYITFSIPKQPQPSFDHKVKMLSKPKLRGSRRISCQIGRQCLSLCEKDWIVREADRWKVISKEKQKQYIEKASSGEVFIFEMIEAKGEKKILTGKLLNSTRTQMKEMQIPLLMRERIERSKRNNAS